MASRFKERVKIGVDENGKPIYVWACGNTKEELHKSIAKILSGQTPQPKKSPKSNDIYWEDYAQIWFTTFHLPNIRPKTEVKDRSLFRNHVKFAFKGKRLSEVTAIDIQSYLQTKSSYCRSQVRDIMWMLKSILASAVEDGRIAKNPMDSDRITNTSQKPNTERKVLSREEQDDILAHIDEIQNPIERILIAFLMYTSLRPCEILGLMWDDIDIRTRTLSVRRDLVFVNGMAQIGQTKTESSIRTIPINRNLWKILEPFQSSGYVIGKNGEHVTSDSVVRTMWRHIRNTIDIHGMTPYVGRHTFATNMSRAGVPIKAAMGLMGHSDERMLLRVYTHVDSEDLLKANEKVAAYIEGIQTS